MTAEGDAVGAATAYGQLRTMIVEGRYGPGERLVEQRIASELGQSRTPVREAVAKLVQEGLVSVFPQAGTFVARIPLDDLPEALVIRSALEETSARLAAARGTEADIAAVSAVLAAARAAAARGDQDAFHAADEAFHAAVADAAGYPGLWHVVERVKLQVDRFRRLTLPEAGRFARVLAEHDAVLRAIARRDQGCHSGSVPSTTLSSTVRLSASMKCWCTIPMPAASAARGWPGARGAPKTSMLPASAT